LELEDVERAIRLVPMAALIAWRDDCVIEVRLAKSEEWTEGANAVHVWINEEVDLREQVSLLMRLTRTVEATPN